MRVGQAAALAKQAGTVQASLGHRLRVTGVEVPLVAEAADAKFPHQRSQQSQHWTFLVLSCHLPHRPLTLWETL